MNFLIITHGPLAMGLKTSVEMIIGQQKNLYTLSLEEGTDLMGFITSVEAKINEISPDNLVVFVDIIGGTPCNSVMALQESYPQIQIFYGVNSPILLEALNSDATSTQDLRTELEIVIADALGFVSA